MSYFRVPTLIFSKVCFNSFTMRYCTPLSSAEGARHVLGRARPNISKTYGNCFFSILNIHIGPKTWHSYKNALLTGVPAKRLYEVGAQATFNKSGQADGGAPVMSTP